MRVLNLAGIREIKQVMRDIKVDPFGIEIMAPKAMHYLVRINSISNIAANILKQETLSLGADAAIARGALTGKTKKTDCLLMGTLSQFQGLNKKLNRQPFGLNELGKKISCALDSYQREDFNIKLGSRNLRLGKRACVMGIVNLTPDSFSGDGLSGFPKQKAIAYSQKLVDDGADIIDVGGESTRPGSKPVSLKEELNRVIPVIEALAKTVKVPISIDTYKPEMARQALDCGASMVNDITGLSDKRMLKIVKQYSAGIIIMHMKGKPRTMQKNPKYDSLIDEIIRYFRDCLAVAEELGIDREKIIIDPGIGFGKTVEHNLEILNRLSEFKVLGRPILVGTSRKSFLGKILSVNPQERIFGTVSSCVLASKNGAKIVRVHDVKEVKQALSISDSINNAQLKEGF